MKKLIMNNQVFPLVFSILFITSCIGQNEPNLSERNEFQSDTILLEKPVNVDEAISDLFALPKYQDVNADSTPPIAEFVVDIFEDKKGNLWFGTMGKGAARYDGKTLTYFSSKDGLPGNTVGSIAEDHQGNIWFGTHNGASKYDPSAKFTNTKAFTNFGGKEGLYGMGCNILIDRSGHVWAGTNDGLFRFDGTSFSIFDLPKPTIENPSHSWVAGKIWSLMEDQKGNIWFGRDGYGACKFDGTSFTHFTKKDGLCSNNVNSIMEDRQGNIWFTAIPSAEPKAIKEGGVSRYDGDSFTNYSEIEGLNEQSYYSIYEDHAGNIWIGAANAGVYRYNGDKFELFNRTNRMDLTSSFSVQSILEDRNGVLWLGFSGGLFRFNDGAIIHVTEDGPWE